MCYCSIYMRVQTLIIFGRSGSGKGTQADLLLKFITSRDPEKRVLYIETGQKFREFAQRDNYTAQLTREKMGKGGLLPEFMPIWVWANSFVENFTGKEHLVLDGLSRQQHEAPILDSALKFYNREHSTIIVINVSSGWAIKRLLERKRNDDNVDDIKRRVEWFDTSVVPTLDYFRNNDRYKMVHIDGEQSIERVHQDIVSAIDWQND